MFCILQDSKGFMWFGTEDGLNKYDGYTFTVYKHDPEDPNSISDNWIQAIYEDRSGDLWIGTLDGGLARFDREKEAFSHYQHDPQDPRSLSDNEVTSIHQDSSGALWVGTTRGLDRLVPLPSSGQALSDAEWPISTQATFEHYRHDPVDPHSLSANAIFCIYEDRDGGLWLGTDGGGLNRLDPSTRSGPTQSESEGTAPPHASFVHYRHVPPIPTA